jgi:hypothetical protein
MGTRKQRTARRFQVEALEIRWTPSSVSGGGLVYGAAHIGEEIPQVQVARPVASGSNSIRYGQEGNAIPAAQGSKPGAAGDGLHARIVAVPVASGSNTIRGGQEGNAHPVAFGSKPGVASGGN